MRQEFVVTDLELRMLYSSQGGSITAVCSLHIDGTVFDQDANYVTSLFFEMPLRNGELTQEAILDFIDEALEDQETLSAFYYTDGIFGLEGYAEKLAVFVEAIKKFKVSG